MRDIAKLLFGEDADKLFGLFREGDGDDTAAERARRSGEWCGTTPGRGSVEGVVRRAARPRGGRRQAPSRDFRAR